MTFTDLTTGRVVGVVPGRDGATVTRWLEQQPLWWREQVKVVAIDPSAAFRSAIITNLPHVKITVDRFHLVKLANDMVTQVRRRVSWDRHDRRGRGTDATWAHRPLLLRGYDTLSENGRARLANVLTHDDPTQEIGAAWGVKEQLRRVLACTDLETAPSEKSTFDSYVTRAAMEETTRLKGTIDRWWPHIETFIVTRATNAETEAANTTIKHIKRTGRGYRNHDNYTCRILITSAARTAT
jgi:transposase